MTTAPLTATTLDSMDTPKQQILDTKSNIKEGLAMLNIIITWYWTTSMLNDSNNTLCIT